MTGVNAGLALLVLAALSLRGQVADVTVAEAMHAGGAERVRLLTEAVAAEPGSARVHYLLGKALADVQDFRGALAAFQDTESRTADRSIQAISLFQEARMCAALGDVARAKELAGRSQNLQRTPEDAELLRELGVGTATVPADAIASSLQSASSSRNLVLEDEGSGAGHAIDLPIEFELGRDRMTAGGRRQAEELGKAMASPALRVATFVVIGHTDNRGGTEYNQALSERRARAVASFLTQQYGISSTRLHPEGHGSREPLARGNSEEVAQLNRRVEIHAILP